MSQVCRMGYFLTLLIGIALTVSHLWHPAPPPPFLGLASADIPAQVGAFQSHGDYEQPAVVKQALASADIISRTYSGGSKPIDFVLIGGTDRDALHDPRACLVGAGWRLDDIHDEAIPGANVTMRVSHAVGLPGTTGYDIMYLYVVDGHLVREVTAIRAKMLLSALIGRKNTPVYFLRFLEPLDSDPQTAQEDHKHLLEFAGAMWTALKPKVTKKA